ncbi:preprotein translocase subunit Tim44 [beta proteobacterium AAP51]|nr:preprotein translocase subunit Tim44 [beta proteobacterium AAP51]
MKTWLIGALALAVFTTSLPFEAEAKRLGGSKSSGMQRDMPARTAPDATPAKPATPAQGQQAAPNNAAAAAAGAAPAAAAKRSWMGPIAGLAAGLGLVALMSHLGMGEAFANFLMLALLAVAVVALVVFLMRRFGGGNMARQPALAGAGAGAGAAGNTAAPWQAAPRAEQAPVQRTAYNEPAAAAPTGFEAPASTAPTAAAAAPVAAAFVPAAFDAEGFARTAKMIFIRLQAAHDTADLDDLKRFTTPELFASLRMDILERGSEAQHTDVQQVEAEVLDVANEADRQIVSVRFHGRVVEEKGADAVDFNEVWHLVKPHDDSRSWAIAGIEQMN